MSSATAPIGLAALEARLREDLEWLELPAKPWVKPRLLDGQELVDVVVIGAGMAGLALATELRHLGILAEVFDQAPEGFEGPWATTARMQTLRSPKQLTGPALGLPALTFRAWYQAQFGLDGWAALDKIPRLQWAQYLRWYRQVMQVQVHNLQRVSRVQPRADGAVALQISACANEQAQPAPREVLARHVVLATGRDGLGGPWVPDYAHSVPSHYWCHSAAGLQGSWFTGKRVGVIGGGSSAMDSAATALEAGATQVDLLIRRAVMPRINKGKGAGNPGMVHGYWRLPDAWKWRIRHYLNTQQVPAPRGSTLRVSAAGNSRFLFDSEVLGIEETGHGSVRVRTAQAELEYDFLVFATGFRADLQQRPEFAPFAEHIRFWGDRFKAPQDEQDSELASLPDLGSRFEFLEKYPGRCPGLERIHCFSYPAALSYGAVSGDIPAISEGAKRMAQGLAGQLFSDDIPLHYASMQAYADPELLGDEWQPGELTAAERLP